MAGDRTPLADFILYVAVVVLVGHYVLFSTEAARPSTVLVSLGLILDVLGAFLLALGLLWSHMVRMATARQIVTRGAEGAPPGIAARGAIWVGVILGSLGDVRATSPGLVANYTELFWGVVLLVLGFGVQSWGLWIAATSGCV